MKFDFFPHEHTCSSFCTVYCSNVNATLKHYHFLLCCDMSKNLSLYLISTHFVCITCINNYCLAFSTEVQFIEEIYGHMSKLIPKDSILFSLN